MVFKKITIMFLPDGGKTVRQLKIPRVLVHFLLIFCISTLTYLAYILLDYSNIRKEFPEREKLVQEKAQQGAQLAVLVGKINQIASKMTELKKFDDKLKIMLDMEPGEDNTQFLGIGGPDLDVANLESAVESSDKKLALVMHQSLNDLDTEIAIQSNEMQQLYEFLDERKSMYASTPSIWPAKGLVTSGFANRISPFTNEREFHEGLDISVRTGTDVIAPADGVVSEIGKTVGFGNLLTISHGYGLKTTYGHLSKVLVRKGQKVKRGEKIALSGNTGRTTGPHLHYEVALNGVPVNPMNYILN